MNTPALMSRADASALPQWVPPSNYVETALHRPAPGARLWAVARRYWWLVALIWLLVAVPLTLLILRMVQPNFVAVGAIRVAPVSPSPLLANNATQTPFYNEFLHTQAEFIKSTRVLQRAMEDPRLKAYAWFRALPDQVDFLSEKVEVQQVTASQLITLSVTHPDAHAATDIVNSVIDAYTRLITEDEENNVGKSLMILRQFRDHTESFLKEAQDKIHQLTADGTTLSAEDDKKVLIDLITASRTTLSKLEADQLNLQATLESLKNRPDPDEQTFKQSIPAETDPQIDKWNAEKVRIQAADNILESKKATPQHPDRVEFRKQLKTLSMRIAQRTEELRQARWDQYKATTAVERTRRTVELAADLKSVEVQVAALRSRITEQDASAKQTNVKLQPIASLREQIADAKESLKRYNDRIQELESQNVAPGRVAVGWNAAVPLTPKVDRRLKLAVAANGGGLILGLFALVLMSRLRNRIESSEDLPETMQPLVVGTVSHAGAAGRGLQARMQRKILGEEMRLVHANLLPPGRQQRRVMMVTSPTPGNGKTSIASHLALSLAKSGLDVLLIDADLRKRDLTSMFDIGFRPGLAELLQGQTPELVQPVELLPNFKVMGAGGKIERNPVELFQRKHLRESLDQVAGRYDCIVIDTPPALVVADARMIAPSCDEVLCVVRAQVSSSRDLHETADALSRITGEAPKIIINGVEHRQSYYKYKFSYGESEHGRTDNGAKAPLGEQPE